MKEYLIDLLSKYLYRKNFFFEKKSFRFIRKEKERACSIRLVFIQNIDVFIYYEIRFDLIEKLIDTFYDRKSSPLEPTVFIDTGDLLVEISLYRFPIDNMRAVEKSAANIINIMENLAFVYFEKYQTLDDLHELLNEIPFQSMKIRNDKYHNEVMSGFFRGILTATLLSKSTEALSRKHIEYLTSKGFGVENIKHYMDFLQWAADVPPLPKDRSSK